jgi:anaerobic magnesium-protoporphyrin IX monomethyl ester cyclase
MNSPPLICSPSTRSVLVLAGEGPYFKYSSYYGGTMFDHGASLPVAPELFGEPLAELRLTDLGRYDKDGWQPLLRPKRGAIPHLTSYTLESIMLDLDWQFELFDLGHVWNLDQEPAERPGVVFLSTTFICAMRTLRGALNWVTDRYGDAVIVLGGQYSNLKYDTIMNAFPFVDVIVRGDGEDAIPALLRALDGKADLSAAPNLVVRTGEGSYALSEHRYIDLEERPSPRFGSEQRRVIPYESMRGCPFRCKFCSFPFASPEWRYKSARKIAEDWARYHDVNDAGHIRAMDSTFTVPPKRLAELMDLLPAIDVTWEAYTRANILSSRAVVDTLAAAHCATLSIGFESMSPKTLKLMNKQVRPEHNRRAHELLHDGPIKYRTSLMVGYPGEAPGDYELTHQYLATDYTGHFMLSVFSMTDETMPVWRDAEELQIRVDDLENPDDGWQHIGMDHTTAHALHARTLDEVRRDNDRAVLLLWQSDYHTPLLPGQPLRTNMWAEKLVERLGMLPLDEPDVATRLDRARDLLSELHDLGIVVGASDLVRAVGGT